MPCFVQATYLYWIMHHLLIDFYVDHIIEFAHDESKITICLFLFNKVLSWKLPCIDCNTYILIFKPWTSNNIDDEIIIIIHRRFNDSKFISYALNCLHAFLDGISALCHESEFLFEMQDANPRVGDIESSWIGFWPSHQHHHYLDDPSLGLRVALLHPLPRHDSPCDLNSWPWL